MRIGEHGLGVEAGRTLGTVASIAVLAASQATAQVPRLPGPAEPGQILRQLEALLIVADKTTSLLISGTGDLISPEEGVLGIGSGGAFALAAARALIRHRPDMTAAQIAKEALLVAAQIDIYTNDHVTLEEV